jgi:UDPglucose 6-dehydrogenase
LKPRPQPVRNNQAVRGPRVVEVVGAGYVGLVTAACLASLGHAVRCVDVNVERIRALESGEVPFSEPGLASLVEQQIRAGRLRFGNDVALGAAGADMVFIAVGTLDGTGRWTDAAVRSVIETLLSVKEVPPLLVVRSTVRPGRMADLDAIVRASGRPTTLLVHPEFTREGTAIADFRSPDRIVIGVPRDCSPDVGQPVADLYGRVSGPILIVDHATAELIKIGSNTFLATKIAFANELARFSRAIGADMDAVRRGVGLDHRIGGEFLRPGPGFGGSCLPSQVNLLASMSEELGLGVELMPAVQRSNRSMAGRIANEILGDHPAPRRVAVLGLAFKANTDDVRESPALRVIDALIARGIDDIRAHDPAVQRLPNYPGVTLEATSYAAVRGADVIVITTEWPEFKTLDWARVALLAARLEVFDTRGAIDVEAATEAGFRVRSLDRPAKPANSRRSTRSSVA